MDKQLIIDTIKALRSECLTLARLGNREEPWETLQSADHLLDLLAQEDDITLATPLDKAVIDAAYASVRSYAQDLGTIQGIFQGLMVRHKFLTEKYNPISIIPADCVKFTRDFWLLFDPYLNPKSWLTNRKGSDETDEQVQLP